MVRQTDDRDSARPSADAVPDSAGFAYAEGLAAYQMAGDQLVPVGPSTHLRGWGRVWRAKPVDADGPLLDDYEIAYITGGPARVVLTAIAALQEQDAIRLHNRLAGRALASMRNLPEDQRFDRAIELSAEPSPAAATEVADGQGHPGTHPVEQEVHAALIRDGRLRQGFLQVLPAVYRVGDTLDARFDARRCERRRRIAVVGGILAALLTWTIVALLSDGPTPDWVLALLTFGGLVIGGTTTWALWDDPVPRAAMRQIKRERSQRGITADALRDRIDGRVKTRPDAFPTMVALSGRAAVWAFAPDLAIATTGLAPLHPAVVPTRTVAQHEGGFAVGYAGSSEGGGGCGGSSEGGGGCGGGCGGCGGCG